MKTNAGVGNFVPHVITHNANTATINTRKNTHPVGVVLPPGRRAKEVHIDASGTDIRHVLDDILGEKSMFYGILKNTKDVYVFVSQRQNVIHKVSRDTFEHPTVHKNNVNEHCLEIESGAKGFEKPILSRIVRGSSKAGFSLIPKISGTILLVSSNVFTNQYLTHSTQRLRKQEGSRKQRSTLKPFATGSFSFTLEMYNQWKCPRGRHAPFGIGSSVNHVYPDASAGNAANSNATPYIDEKHRARSRYVRNEIRVMPGIGAQPFSRVGSLLGNGSDGFQLSRNIRDDIREGGSTDWLRYLVRGIVQRRRRRQMGSVLVHEESSDSDYVPGEASEQSNAESPDHDEDGEYTDGGSEDSNTSA